MKTVVLYFPTTSSLADFIISYVIAPALVNTGENSVTATLTEELVEIATEAYGGVTKEQCMNR